MGQLRTTTVWLGEEQVELREAGFKNGAAFRRGFNERIMPLFEKAPEYANFELETAADLAKLVPLLQTVVVDAIDDVVALVFTYWPFLETRDGIEEASEAQLVQAFIEAVKFAVPFEMSQLTQLMALADGLTPTATSSSSRTQNGERTSEKSRTSKG